MGVIPVEIPDGSGKWYVRIRWQISADKRFRKTKLVGMGEKGKESAFYKAHVLDEAWTKFGTEAIKLIGPEMPGAPEAPEEPNVPTVDEYGPKFLQRMRSAGLKRSTCACYETNLRVHIYPALGQLAIDELNYSAIADFLAGKADSSYSTARFRAKEKKGKKKKLPPGQQHRYSRDTIRIMAMTLRAMMAEAVKDGIIPVNPVAGLSRFYRKKKSDRIIKRSDVFQTIEDLHRCEDKMAERFPEYYEFTLCMSREGMRIGETVALTLDDIDLNSGTFNINKNVPSGTGELEDSAKTDSGEREDEFWSPECLEAIRAMLKRRRIEYFQRGEEMPEYLFTEKSGRRVEYSRFAKAWKQAQKLAGMGRFRSPHALRHGWASQMIAAGEDIASVSKHLGHANVGITLSIYVHFLPKKKRLPGNILDRTGAEELAASGQV